MEKMKQEGARKLVNRLERTGSDCGLLAVKGVVVMRCPGAPYNDTPTMFYEADLLNAATLGLLEKKSMMTGSVTGADAWEWYVSKRKPVKSGDWIILSNGSRRKIDGIEQGIAFYGKGELSPSVQRRAELLGSGPYAIKQRGQSRRKNNRRGPRKRAALFYLAFVVLHEGGRFLYRVNEGATSIAWQ